MANSVITRRSLFRLAAPAIVLSTSLMKVSALAMPPPWDIEAMAREAERLILAGINPTIYQRRDFGPEYGEVPWQ